MALCQQLAINMPNIKFSLYMPLEKSTITLEPYCPLAPNLDYVIQPLNADCSKL